MRAAFSALREVAPAFSLPASAVLAFFGPPPARVDDTGFWKPPARPCQDLEGELSAVAPHDALQETDRRDMRETTEGRIDGEVVLYRCRDCDACFTRDLERNDPLAHWETGTASQETAAWVQPYIDAVKPPSTVMMRPLT